MSAAHSVATGVLTRSRVPAAYIFSLAVYLTVGIPACRTVADPVPDVDTHDDQVEALRILSAGNTIIIVLLGAILTLQARARYYRYDDERCCAVLTDGWILCLPWLQLF